MVEPTAPSTRASGQSRADATLRGPDEVHACVSKAMRAAFASALAAFGSTLDRVALEAQLPADSPRW